MFSHEQVFDMMHSYIIDNLVADKKGQRKDDTITCEVNKQKIVIVSPIGIKQAPTLERMIRENTLQDVATVVILPKSSKFYDGNYLKEKRKYESVDQTGKVRYHPNAELSTIEMFLVDNYAPVIPYFNPKDKRIDPMRFRKFSKKMTAFNIGFVPFGEFGNDDAIWTLGRKLKHEFGEGHSSKIYDEFERGRYIELARINEDNEQTREKFSDSPIKGSFTLKTIKKNGLLMAKVIPSPITREEYYSPRLF